MSGRRSPALVGAWVVLALTLAACGPEGPAVGALRVEIVSAAADGSAPETGWRLVAERGGELSLAPSPQAATTSGGRVLEARGPAGRYGIVGPKGWALVGGDARFALQPDLPPVSMGVGRSDALYLVPPEGTEVREVLLTEPDGKPLDPAIRVERAVGPDRRCVLRFVGGPPPPKNVRAHATLADGTFVDPARIALLPGGTPTGAALRRASAVPLDVLVTDLSTGAPAPGYRLAAHLVFGPLASDREGILADALGAATLEELPSELAAGSYLSGDGGGFWPIDVDTLRDGVVRVVRMPRDGPSGVLRVVRSSKSAPSGTLELRGEASQAYGLVPVARPAAGTATLFEARVPVGRYSVLVRDGDRVFVVDDLVEVRSEAKALVPYEGVPTCHVQVTIVGGMRAGRRLTLRAHRREGAREVLAQGFEVRRLARSEHELRLPPGKYRIVLSEGDRDGPPSELSLDQPGMRVIVRVEPPR